MTEPTRVIDVPAEGTVTKIDPGALTPAAVGELMGRALDSGNPAAIASLEGLVALAERVDDRRNRAAFNSAFARFRGEVPAIAKDKRGEVASNQGTPWGWWYAPLEGIQKTVDPILHRHGLSYRFSNDESVEGKTTVICTVCHVDGHSEESSVTISKGGSNRKMSPGQQDAGTLTTAMRRVLSMALGLATSDPEDPPAGPPEDGINDEQAATLDDYLDQLGTPVRSRFLSAMGIERVGDLPAFKYEGARKQLAAKLEAQNG
jgi:hypothetical protein